MTGKERERGALVILADFLGISWAAPGGTTGIGNVTRIAGGKTGQMEREMCSYLDWELNVDSETMARFERAVKKDFAQQQDAYPTYPVEMVSKRAVRAAVSTTATPIPEPNSTTSPIPMFSQQRNATPTKPSHPPSRSSSTWSSPNSSDPDTPPATYSNSTSPASSASPTTPSSMEEYNPKIQGADLSPHFALAEVPPPLQMKEKVFAIAIPAVW